MKKALFISCILALALARAPYTAHAAPNWKTCVAMTGVIGGTIATDIVFNKYGITQALTNTAQQHRLATIALIGCGIWLAIKKFDAGNANKPVHNTLEVLAAVGSVAGLLGLLES